MQFNYGLLPQTWSDSNTPGPYSEGHFGDRDPLDFIDVSTTSAQTGQVYPVMVLGALPLLDQGELDWKVVGVHAGSREAQEALLAQDVTELSWLNERIGVAYHWFTGYKVPAGKPRNTWLENGELLGPKETVELIGASHQSWTKLVETPPKHASIHSVLDLWLPTSPIGGPIGTDLPQGLLQLCSYPDNPRSPPSSSEPSSGST